MCFWLISFLFCSRLWCKYDMTRNGHTLEYMDFLKRLGVNAKSKNQVNKAGTEISLKNVKFPQGNYTVSANRTSFYNKF